MDHYKVWCPDYGHTEDDAIAIRVTDTYDASTAATNWASEYEQFSAEYPIAGGEVVSVVVKKPDGEIKSFHVFGETVPQYRACEIRS